MSMQRAGYISIRELVGLRFVFICAGLTASMLLASLIIWRIGVSIENNIPALQNQLSNMPKTKGATWRELEKSRIADLNNEAQKLTTQYRMKLSYPVISPLGARQKIEEIITLLKSSAEKRSVTLPEEIKFPLDLQEREKAGYALGATELASQLATYFISIDGSSITSLTASAVENNSAVFGLEAGVPGNRFGDLMLKLQGSGFIPQSMEITRGEGISPLLQVKMSFYNEFDNLP